jgi:N-methylhydantoinase A
MMLMQSHGGLGSAARVATHPVALIESGPVSGLFGAASLGNRLGYRNIIAADMGGTTFKVGSVREGLVEYQRESRVFRYHHSVPKLDIASFSLAGGSIVTLAPVTGAPAIGPRSAGSYPGPVCYGYGGTDPTLTDVDVLLGYLDGRYFLGGRRGLDREAARARFHEAVASPLGSTVADAAADIFRLSTNRIYDFLRRITVERGLDPREFALFSTGGAAGMHLPAVGQRLGVGEIVVPRAASVFGAMGLVGADVVVEELVTEPLAHPADPVHVESVFRRLVSRVRGQLASARRGLSMSRETVFDLYADMRFQRQVHIVTVPLMSIVGSDRWAVKHHTLDEAVARFEHMYEQRYGPESAYREAGVQLVSFRVRGRLPTRLDLRFERPLRRATRSAVVEERRVYVPDLGEVRPVPCLDFDRLRAGNEVVGPAVVWTPITTVVLGSRQRARLDGMRNIRITEKP